MFFCDHCKDKNNWPSGIVKSHGKCEVCGQTDLCSDIPSKFLPPPKHSKD